ncbi:hypothetical protein M422DRAFT_783515 [Sphaerobolus stellatus SS14]|uniref:Uncharacterized protein n=1 Tax=Sphaerobolus stellatus (strain SS14) TaxID=990650 RepID=A0A0C9V484_SPHS4|nr:hypothetical protein M422DRAFT_783515 [Sphaerobolus stellatus SS14]
MATPGHDFRDEKQILSLIQSNYILNQAERENVYCIIDIQDLQSKNLAERISNLKSHLRLLEDKKAGVDRQINLKKALIAPIRKLLEEIISLVFLWVADMPGDIFYHVFCEEEYKPRSEAVITSYSPPLVISRVCALPLQIYIDPTDWKVNKKAQLVVFQTLKRHLHRIEVLSIPFCTSHSYWVCGSEIPHIETFNMVKSRIIPLPSGLARLSLIESLTLDDNEWIYDGIAIDENKGLEAFRELSSIYPQLEF